MNDDELPKVPTFRRGYRFQFEPAQGCHVLLYPEGMIKLNESAALILEQVDGQQSVGQLTDALAERFPEAPGLRQDVMDFLEVARGRHWIELR